MKYLLSLFFVLIVLNSCDYIMKKEVSLADTIIIKKQNKDILKDKKECVSAEGYRWSIINNKCLRLINEGFRLNSITDLMNLETSRSAFVILDAQKLQAEIFLPDAFNSIYIKRKSVAEDFFEKEYKLSLNNGHILYKNDVIIFKDAVTSIKPVLGSDYEEQ